MHKRTEGILYGSRVAVLAVVCVALSPFTLTAVGLGFTAIHMKIAYDHHRYATKEEKEKERTRPTFHGRLGRRLHTVRQYVPDRLIRRVRNRESHTHQSA